MGKLGQKVEEMPTSSLNVEVATGNCQLTEMMNECPTTNASQDRAVGTVTKSGIEQRAQAM